MKKNKSTAARGKKHAKKTATTLRHTLHSNKHSKHVNEEKEPDNDFHHKHSFVESN